MPAPTISSNVPVIPRTRQAKRACPFKMPPPGPAIGGLRRPVRIADGLFGDNYEKHPNSPCTSSCGHLPENSLCPRGLGGVHPGFVRARWQSWVRRARQGAGVFRSLRLSVLERQLIGANRRPARRFAPAGFACPVPRPPLYCCNRYCEGRATWRVGQ